MIFHSIVPLDIIFNTGGQLESNYYEIDYLGEKVQVSLVNENEYKINRLISTSLKSYLDPRLQPGAIIKRTFQ